VKRIVRKSGDTVKLVTGPVRVGGELVELVGATLRFGATRSYATLPVLEKTFGPIVEDDLLAEDPADPGQRVLWEPIEAGDTDDFAELAAETLAYDVELELPDGALYTIDSGYLTLRPDVASA
jgi:hypothetical protein